MARSVCVCKAWPQKLSQLNAITSMLLSASATQTTSTAMQATTTALGNHFVHNKPTIPTIATFNIFSIMKHPFQIVIGSLLREERVELR
jgi:hypothetical protein